MYQAPERSPSTRCVGHHASGTTLPSEEELERSERLLDENQGQNLALTILCVPCSLDSDHRNARSQDHESQSEILKIVYLQNAQNINRFNLVSQNVFIN